MILTKKRKKKNKFGDLFFILCFVDLFCFVETWKERENKKNYLFIYLFIVYFRYLIHCPPLFSLFFHLFSPYFFLEFYLLQILTKRVEMVIDNQLFVSFEKVLPVLVSWDPCLTDMWVPHAWDPHVSET